MNTSHPKFTVRCGKSDLERRATGICVIACAVIVVLGLVHLVAFILSGAPV